MKQPKYRNKKVVIDGITFMSTKEGNRYLELKLLERAGEISHLELQPKFKLFGRNGPILIKSKGFPNGRHATYIADFAYFCPRRDKRISEDCKGYRTAVFILKKAIVEACYPGVEIVEI